MNMVNRHFVCLYAKCLDLLMQDSKSAIQSDTGQLLLFESIQHFISTINSGQTMLLLQIENMK